MFVNVVTIEKDAEEAFSNEDVAIFATRVSYRTAEQFQSIEKDGKPGKSNIQFVDASFKVFKRKDKDSDGPKKLLLTKDHLTQGTIVFVEGEIGIDVVPKKGDTKEKSYFTKLRSASIRVVGKRPPKTGPTGAQGEKTSEPAMAGAGKTERLEPRKPKDQGDELPADFFY